MDREVHRRFRFAWAWGVTVFAMLALAAAVRAEVGEAAAGTSLFFDVTRSPFAAVADGRTDDTRAIQAAIDACDPEIGGTVYFPPGRYLVDTVVLTRPNLTLQGSSALIIKKTPAAGESQPAGATPDHVFKDTAGVASGLSCRGLKFDLGRPSFTRGHGV